MDYKTFLPSAPADYMSDGYVFIDSKRIVELMQDNGMSMTKFSARKSDPFGKHYLEFQPAGQELLFNEVAPRIILCNSYDGTAKARIIQGLFRLVCTNGLVTGSIYDSEATMHIGEDALKVIEKAVQSSKDVHKLVKQIEEWKGLHLTPAEQLQYSEQALALRFSSNSFSASVLAQPRRRADVGSDLWRLFNRIQENCTKGGLPGMNSLGQPVMSRGITSFDTDHTFNRKLWEMTSKFVETIDV